MPKSKSLLAFKDIKEEELKNEGSSKKSSTHDLNFWVNLASQA